MVVPIVIDGFRRSFDKKGLRIKKKNVYQTFEINIKLPLNCTGFLESILYTLYTCIWYYHILILSTNFVSEDKTTHLIEEFYIDKGDKIEGELGEVAGTSTVLEVKLTDGSILQEVPTYVFMGGNKPKRTGGCGGCAKRRREAEERKNRMIKE